MCDVLLLSGIRSQISDRGRGVFGVTVSQNDFLNLFFFCLFSFQYYEMSYGLNIEMHKQVGAVLVLIRHLGGFSTGSGLSFLWTCSALCLEVCQAPICLRLLIRLKVDFGTGSL